MKSSFVYSSVVSCSLALLVSCEAGSTGSIILEQRVLTTLNPTNYTFNASLDQVHNAIKSAYDSHWFAEQVSSNQLRVWRGGGSAKDKNLLTTALQLPPGFLFFKGDSDALSDGLLTRPGNENDAYYFANGTPVCESRVYSKDGAPLPYYADFHIHVDKIDPTTTRVTVTTYHSRVVTGVERRLAVHGTRFIPVEVPPTTIEQYEILRRIGAQLGLTSMPPVAVPATNAPILRLTPM